LVSDSNKEKTRSDLQAWLTPEGFFRFLSSILDKRELSKLT